MYEIIYVNNFYLFFFFTTADYFLIESFHFQPHLQYTSSEKNNTKGKKKLYLEIGAVKQNFSN